VPRGPVVEAGGRLIGRVTYDDVIDVAEAEATEDLLRFGGVSPDEGLAAGWGVWKAGRRRPRAGCAYGGIGRAWAGRGMSWRACAGLS